MAHKTLLVKQKVPYTHPNGDIIYGHYDQYIRAVTKNEYVNQNFLPLIYLGLNNWSASMQIPMIEKDMKKLKRMSAYQCPITKHKVNGLLPLAMMGQEVDKYLNKNSWFYEMATDQDYNKNHMKEYQNASLGVLETLQMGSGYTDGCLPSDGGHSLLPVMIDLTNGDKILCATFVWHNK